MAFLAALFPAATTAATTTAAATDFLALEAAGATATDVAAGSAAATAASTAATAATWASIVGTGVSAYSATKQGQYQAGVAKVNQKLAKQNAALEIQSGQVKEEAQRRKTAAFIGSQRAAAGASGIDVNEGSPLRLQEDSAKLGELDALTIRSNAQETARGYGIQAAGYGAQASMEKQAGNLDAFASIIGGASSLGSKWASWKQAGLNPSLYMT